MGPAPVFVGNDSSLHLLVVLANADGEPGAQLAVVEGVHHAEDLALVEAQAVRRLLLVLEVGPDVERVSHVRLHDPPVHWRRRDDRVLIPIISAIGTNKTIIKNYKTFLTEFDSL